jgi:thiosulfate/3-mercaptopyruvate sulfurtransferase
MCHMTTTCPILVDETWVIAHPDVIVADVRWYLDGRDGRAAFEEDHIAGAIFVDLNTDLSGLGRATDGRHPLPSPEGFAVNLGRLGIGEHDTVVAYDDSGGGTAGRLVWMLRSLGRNAALLDGGLKTWRGERATGPAVQREQTKVPTVRWPADKLASMDDIAKHAGSSLTVLDARSAERYRGENEPVEARAGHIPGAVSAPWNQNLDPATGRFLSAETLRARFIALGVSDGDEVAGSCGSGVSTCANLIALEIAGFTNTKLFVPSFSGWAADPNRPVATGVASATDTPNR